MANRNPKTAHLKKFYRIDGTEPLAAPVMVRVPEDIAVALKKLSSLERAAFLRRVISEAVRKELMANH